MLMNHRWPGNVRQLKNLAEQLSVIEKERNITADIIGKYLPSDPYSPLPVLFNEKREDIEGMNEREILYKLLFGDEAGYH